MEHLTLEQAVETVLDAQGAPFLSVKQPDGTVLRTYRRSDLYAAIDILRELGCEGD